MVNTQDISRTCYCPLRTRTGHFCGASSKFRIHINDETGEYRYACRTHLPHVLSEFPEGSEPIIYSVEQSDRRIHAILRRVVFDPETRRVRTVFPLIPQTNEEEESVPPQTDDDVNGNVVHTPLFRFSSPVTNYGSMYTTPPATPEQTSSSPPPPPPPRPQFPLQRANAGWSDDSNENVGLFGTDWQYRSTLQSSFMNRLNQAWSPTFIPQFNEQHTSPSPPPPPPPTMENVNSMVVQMIRHRGVKLNPSSNTCVECSVCLTHDVEPNTGGALRCGHTFHNECISKWFIRGKFNCPCCRASADILPLIDWMCKIWQPLPPPSSLYHILVCSIPCVLFFFVSWLFVYV